MKQIKKFKPYIILYSIIGAVFLLYAIFGTNKSIANYIVNNFTRPYRSFMGKITSFLPFSIAEFFWIIIILFTIFYIGFIIYKIFKSTNLVQTLIKFVLNITGAILVIYASFTILWGIDYKADSFIDKSLFSTSKVSTADLKKTSQLFLNKLNSHADKVKRSEEGVFAENINDIFAQSDKLYAAIEQEYPFLHGEDYKAKAMLFSPILSLANFTGFYFPLTGESTINTDQPLAYIASTIAHELAHQRGIVEEDAANFLAIRVCDESKSAIYNYSGALLAYIHLSNALYTADNEAWKQQMDSLSQYAKADLNANNIYWKKYKTPIAKVSNKVYEDFLQGYGDEDGLKSYGAVVDWLVAYYAN